MKTNDFKFIKILSLLLLLSHFSNKGFAEVNFTPPPPPSNNNCANAINVVVNGPVVSGITQGATTEPGEINDCASVGSTQTVWYYFTATTNHVAVSLTLTNIVAGSCYFSSAIWPASSGCPASVGCHPISCQSASGGPLTTVHDLSNLTVGNNYYIQILYDPTGACANFANFDVSITTVIPANPSNPPPVSTCQAPSGNACVFNFNPTNNQVTNTCTSYNNPVYANNDNEVYQACFTFTAQYSCNVSFNNIINSDCGAGNVVWLDWQLYDISCNSVACGDLSNLNATGLICGNTYNLCMSYEIPLCTHTKCYPFIVAIPPTLNINPSAGNSLTICKFSSTQLVASAVGDVSYQWAPSIGLSSTTGPIVTASPTVTTTYTVTGFDAGGCTQTNTVVVVVKPLPNIVLNPTNASCGNANGFLPNTTTGGGSPFNFLWSTGSTLEDLSGIPAGSYSVTATNSFGCTSTATAIVPSVGLFTPVVDIQQLIYCFGATNGKIKIIPPTGVGYYPPYTFLWSTGATTATINNLPAGSYTVTITNSQGCTFDTTTVLLSPPAISFQFVANNISCFGGTGSITVHVTGGSPYYAFNWSNGGTDSTITGLAAGNYKVTVHDFQGCSAVSNNVTISPAIPINFSPTITNISCGGSGNGAVNVTINGGNPPYTFLWSNGQTTQNATGLTVGPISVNIFDSNGCPYTWSGNITSGLSPILGAVTANVTCFGNTNGGINLSVAGGTAPYSYQWSNGTTIQDLNNVAANNYTVTVTDFTGCSVTGNYLITTPATLQLSETHLDAGCTNNAGSINLTVTGGTSPYLFHWNTNATTQNLPVGLSAGTYSVTVTDANNCTIGLSIPITQPPHNIVTLEKIDPSCGINNGTAEIDQVTGGGGPFTFIWNNGGTDNEIDNLPAGTYSITVTNSWGCTSTASIVLITANGPTLSFTHIDATCGNANGSINTIVNGGTGPFAFLWNTGATSVGLPSISGGTYNVTVTDTNNCQVTGSVVVAQQSAPVLSQTNNNSTCGFQNGSINLIVVGNGPYTFLWNDGSTVQSPPAIGAGTYSVTVTDNNSCTSFLSGIIVSTSPLPQLAYSTSGEPCHGDAVGTVFSNVIGGVLPFSFIWSNGSTTPNLNNLIAGFYFVTVTDANNCTVQGGVIINEPAVNVISEIHSNAFCGLLNGSINLSVTGPFPPYTYLWSNAETTPTITGIGAGAYTVTVSNTNSCTSTLTVNISNVGGPTLTETHVNVLCHGDNTGSITITAANGAAPYSYAWSNGATTAINPSLTANNYTVTVTDNNNCQATLTISITEPALALSLSETHTDASCGTANGSITLTTTGGTIPYSYIWSNGTTTAINSSLTANTYSVTVTDGNNCTSTINNINIINTTGPTLSETHVNVLCHGDNAGSITITSANGTAPYTYAWSNGATTAINPSLTANNYTVTVTDNNNCQATLTISITEPALALSLSETHTDASCGTANGSITLTTTGGTIPYSYIWSNGTTTAINSSLTANTYSVTVTDGNNCTSTINNINIINTTGPTLSETHVNVLCHGDNAGSITITSANGTAPYTYAWSNGATTAINPSLTANNYTVTVTDNNNCQATLTISITEPALALSLSETHTDASCGTANGSITLTTTGGTIPYSYIWSNGTTTAINSSLTANTYSVTVTDGNNCTSTINNINIINTTGPTLSETHVNVLCHGDNTGSITITAANGTAPYSYAWSNGATTAINPSLTANNYTVTVTDNNNCQATLTISITEPALALSLSETHTDASCGTANGSITLTTTGGTIPYSYIWSNGTTTAINSSLTANTYSVTVTDGNNCTSTINNINIINTTGPTLSETHVNVLCHGDNAGSITITSANGTAPYTYAWSNGATTAVNQSLTANNYTVTVTDNNNCQATLTISITEPALALSLSETHTDASCGTANGSITLTTTGGTIPYSYIWSNGTTTAINSSLTANTYSVTVTDGNNCTSTINNINIINTTGPTLSETHVNVLCHGDNTGSITITAANGTAPYSYAWSNGATTAINPSLTANNYTVTVTDNNNCQATLTISITEPALALSLSETHTDASCGTANGSITLTTTGGTIPYSYIWSNGTTTAINSSLTANTYSVTVTDGNNCTSTINNINIINTTGPTLSETHVNVLCHGDNAGSITITSANGTAPYTYAWSNGATTAVNQSLTANNYTVTVTDNNNCQATLTIPITEPALALSISETHVNANCGTANGSITLTASGGTIPYSYIWSNGTTTAINSSLTANSYSVTVTDGNNCTSTINNINIINTTGPTLSETHVNVLCHGDNTGSITITAANGTAPYTYAWSNGATTAVNQSLTANNYTVTVTDNNNCQATLTISITEPALALSLSETHTDASCGTANGSITLTTTGGTIPYSYIWSNGTTTAINSSLTANSYSVTVTDGNNCSSTINNINIINTTGPTLSETHVNVLCHGDNTGSITIIAANGTAPYTYAWSNGATTAVNPSLTANNYTVTVTDNNNCQATLTIPITEPALALSISETHTDASCGTANGSITLTASGGTTPYTYSWSNGVTTANNTLLTANNYSVTVTDGNNCTNNLTVNILNGNGPNLSENHVDAHCGISNGSITLMVVGGANPYSFSWSNNATTQNITSLIGGIYDVTVTDFGGCTATLSVNIQGGSAITFQSVVTDVSCFGFNDGAIDLTITSGTAPFSYHWDTNATTQDLNGINGNNYDVTITDFSGCTLTSTINVTEHAQLTPSQTHVNETCGQSNGSISLNVFGGYQPYTYLWNDNSIGSSLSGIPAGNYSVTVSDFNLCSSVLNIVVTGTSGPGTQFLTTNISCNGNINGAINLTITGGTQPYSYLWSNNSVIQDINNLPAGNYSVTVTDGNNCSVTADTTLTQPLAIVLSETHTDASCGTSNGSIDLSISGGVSPYSFIWSNGFTTEDLASLSIGTYDVTITDANNCTTTISVNIINGNGTLPLTFTTVDETCSGINGSINLNVNAGTPPYNFIWSNNDVTEDIGSLAAATYDVTVTDIGGCSGTTSVIINNHPTAQLSETHVDETCGYSNGSIDLTVAGGTVPLTYLWSTNDVIQDIAQLSAANYTVTVSDANNCSVTLSVQVLNTAGPVISQIHNDENCNQANGSIDLTINNGVQPFNLIWSNAAITEDLTNLSAGNYTITVTDANGCSDSQSISINNFAGPQLNETHISTSCGLINGSIDLSVAGGVLPFTYHWNNNSVTQDLLNLNSGNYDVTITDAGGCTATLSGISISNSSAPQLSEAHTTSTCGNSNAGIDITVSNGTAPYNYLWNNNSVSEDLSNILSGNYSVTVTDAATCSVSINVVVSDIVGPQLVLNPLSTSCGMDDGTIDLIVNNGTAAFNYLWSNGAISEDVSGLAGGNYVVTVSDANGCSAIANADVIASTYPVMSATISGNNGCIPLNVLFTNTSINAVTYNWVFGDGASSNAVSPTHQYNQVGNFAVLLIETSSTGCTDTLAVDTVSIYETPIADFSSVPWINETTLLSLAQFQFTNQSVFASSYLWNFGDGNNSHIVNPTYSYTSEGEFYVTLFAFNSNGCADTVTYGPFILLADGDVFIPNSFTPNGDHVNDVFEIYGTGISNVHMWIYDRWGEKLYEENNGSPAWNGDYHNVKLNVGVYVYEIEITRYDGTIEWKKGDVTLIR